MLTRAQAFGEIKTPGVSQYLCNHLTILQSFVTGFCIYDLRISDFEHKKLGEWSSPVEIALFAVIAVVTICNYAVGGAISHDWDPGSSPGLRLGAGHGRHECCPYTMGVNCKVLKGLKTLRFQAFLMSNREVRRGSCPFPVGSLGCHKHKPNCQQVQKQCDTAQKITFNEARLLSVFWACRLGNLWDCAQENLALHRVCRLADVLHLH